MSKLKIILIICGILLVFGLAGYSIMQTEKLKQVRQELVYATNNYQALDEENSSLKTTKKNLMLTVEQLKDSKDSIVVEMNKVRKELKIKDKEIESLRYIASLAQKRDTICIKDTIFTKDVHIDTTISDSPWYNCNIKLDYPNQIIVAPEFESQKHVVTYISKEIQNPKKCKLLRLFQKKVTIVETEVVEKNPYIKNKQTKFLEIIK